MIKFIILYLLILLNIQNEGKLVNVELKIKDDWEVKREFIYLKNVEIKERFVMIMNVKQGYKIENYLYKKTGSFRKLEINLVKNVFNTIICI